MSWKGMDLVVRIVGDLKRYRADLREAGRDTQQAMGQAKAATDGLTAAQRGLEGQAGRTAGQLVDVGRAAASGDYARAGQQVAGMASSMSTAAAGAGALGSMLGVATAALAGYLVISYKAAAEHERQANLLALTGNAAGLVAGDMNRMASRVAEAGNTTVGAAREIAEALVGTGKVGRPALESLGTAIALFARASGESEAQVTGDFAKMADGVAKWAAEHNERYHFLTLDQYRYIQALEDAGNKQQAMKVVGEAFITHLKDIDKNVGYLQASWRGLKRWASEAWDAMLGWGREDTLAQKIAAAEKTVAGLTSSNPATGNGWGAAQGRQRLADAQAQLETLRESARLERRAADAKSERAAATAAAIAQEQEDEKAKKRSTTATDKLTAAEKALREERDREAKFQQIVIDKEAEWAEEAAKAARQSAEVEAFFRQKEIDAEQRWDKQRQDAADKLREDERKAWEKTWEQVSESFTDALMQGGKSVKDYLAGLFRTLVLRPVLAPIGAAMASAVTPSMAGVTQAAGGVGGVADLLGGLGQVGALASAFGTGMAASFTSMMSAGVSGWATAAGSLIGSGSMAGIAAGIGMIAAPLAAAAVLWKPLFGRTLKDTGLEGTFSGTDALSANTYKFYKGGLFRSDKTRRSALDEGVRSGLAGQYEAMTGQSAAMAQALGLGTDALAGYSHSFKFSTKGMNEEQINARLTEEFAKMADAQALLLMGTADYVREGEAAADALVRLSTALTGVNQVMDTLGLQAMAVSMAGGDMASSLVELFGGLEAFGQASTAYYQAFYSDAERLATSERQLTSALGALGLAMPGTRDGFRALVEAQDLTTEAGRSTYATLMGLAPAFAELTQTMAQLGSTVGDEVQRLRGLLTTDSRQSLAALQAQFATGTAQARAGDMDALERLPELSQAIEAAAALQAVTAADVALMRGQLAASLSETLRGLGLEVPAFAVGTNYVPKTMLAKIHEGEAIVPRAYNPAAGGMAPGSEAMAARLEAVVAELKGLRDEVRSGVTHSAKTARILDRVARDGDAFVTVDQV